jgi:hypothetical protein
MKFRFFPIIVLSFVATIFAVGDHFPIAQGNTWLFSYVKSRGGWGTVIKDSGTVQWQMQLVTNDSVTTTITILRTFNLCRNIYTPGPRELEGGGGTAFDSVFSPPRTSVDTLYITSSNRETGLGFKGDTCKAFVHDPKASLPTGSLSVRDTLLPCMGKMTSASIIDQAPCRNIYADQELYITVQDIGPVEYHNHSSPYLMDAFWEADWKLITTNVATSIKIRKSPVALATSMRLLKQGKEALFEGLVSKTGKLIGSFYTVNGAMIGKFETEIASPGFQRILISGRSYRGKAGASGPCILKLLLPDGMKITEKMLDF